MQYRPNAPAPAVDAALRKTLEEIHRTEGHAVLWFAEVSRRRLFRELGYGSIHQYAEDRLGFSRSRTAQYLAMTDSLERLPALRESLVRGRTTWTKVRTVAAVATPRTESVWRERVETMSRRDLEKHVARVRAEAERKRTRRGQARLALTRKATSPPSLPTPRSPKEASPQEEPVVAASSGAVEIPFEDPRVEREAVEVPLTVTLRLSPVQAARYEALREKARKIGLRQELADPVLAGLEELVESERDRRGADPCPRAETEERPEIPAGRSIARTLRRVPRGTGSPYEIHVAVCPECERGRIETLQGSRVIGLPQLRASACDARVRGDDGTNRSTIPPRVRRQVLDRDGHRCRAAACGGTRFLEVHHRTPRSRGGSNHPDNLITLCSACHQATHTHEPGDHPLRN